MFIDFTFYNELGDLYFLDFFDLWTLDIFSNNSLFSLSISIYLVSSILFFFGF